MDYYKITRKYFIEFIKYRNNNMNKFNTFQNEAIAVLHTMWMNASSHKNDGEYFVLMIKYHFRVGTFKLFKSLESRWALYLINCNNLRKSLPYKYRNTFFTEDVDDEEIFWKNYRNDEELLYSKRYPSGCEELLEILKEKKHKDVKMLIRTGLQYDGEIYTNFLYFNNKGKQVNPNGSILTDDIDYTQLFPERFFDENKNEVFM